MSKERLTAHDTPFHLMLSYGPLGLVRATLLDLNEHGMTVDTGAITLADGVEVEIAFTQNHHNEYITHRLLALVKRSFQGGAELMFSSFAHTTLEVLQRLLEHERNAPERRFARARSRLPATRWPLYPASPLPPNGRF